MADISALKIESLEQMNVDQWNKLVSCLGEIDQKIPDKRWKFNDLILDNNVVPAALHFNTNQEGDSSISNRNDFLDNQTTSNNNLEISSAKKLSLQTVDQNNGKAIDRMVIDEKGHIGIGSSNPERALHIQGTEGFTNDLLIESNGSSSGALIFRRSDGKNQLNSGDALGLIVFQGYTNSKYEHGASIRAFASDNFAEQANTELKIYTSFDGKHKERLSITDRGHIRVTSESGWMDIGSKNVDGAHFQTDRDKYHFDKEIRVNSGKIGSHKGNLQLCISGQPHLTIAQTSGNVGIGIQNPKAKLHVDGSIETTEKLIEFKRYSASQFTIYSERNLRNGTNEGRDFEGFKAANTKYDAEYWDAAIVGIDTGNAKVDTNGQGSFLRVMMQTYDVKVADKLEKKWFASASLRTNSKHEEWTVDVMFVRKNISKRFY